MRFLPLTGRKFFETNLSHSKKHPTVSAKRGGVLADRAGLLAWAGVWEWNVPRCTSVRWVEELVDGIQRVGYGRAKVSAEEFRDTIQDCIQVHGWEYTR